MIKSKLIEPQTLALSLISILPPRNQDIIKKRYGIINNQSQTLDSIGKIYQVTRERIRQIIESSLNILKTSSKITTIQPFWDQAKVILENLGGIEEEIDFLNILKKELQANESTLNTLKFLLLLSPEFVLEEENNKTVAFWHLKTLNKTEIENNIKKIEELFKKQKSVLLLKDILKWAQQNISPEINETTLNVYLKIIKSIGKNPFGEYGLKKWPEIEPLGTKNRVYQLLIHRKQPLHFSEIAKYLNENTENIESPLVLSRSWYKKVQIQTVHNELIKDPRFVLVGRGIYGLKDWGYKPGKVADVIKEVLKEANKPLTQEEIIKEVQKKRLVKVNTIILNLHNTKLFKKLDDGRYTLKREYKILEV